EIDRRLPRIHGLRIGRHGQRIQVGEHGASRRSGSDERKRDEPRERSALENASCGTGARHARRCRSRHRFGSVAPRAGRLLYRPAHEAHVMPSEPKFTYKDAGVDIDAGAALVERIKAPIRRTLRPEVIGGIGGFGGLFRVPSGYKEPVLVAGTDGVGTKLKLAIEHDAHDGVGIDLVAMCVNDVIVQGAEPLFFLDYFVTPRLDVDVAERVIAGIARGCELAGA